MTETLWTSTSASEDESAATSALWNRLKSGTKPFHDRLDKRIMEAKPFESRENYARFLRVQHDFHRLVSPLYQRPDVGQNLPDLKMRDRLQALEGDLADLDVKPSEKAELALSSLDRADALGWIYVAEGSNLGAAFLLKAARGLGLSEQFGARHLAAAPEGRGLRWRTFTTALDALALSYVEQDRVVDGANRAFDTVRGLVEVHLFVVPEKAAS